VQKISPIAVLISDVHYNINTLPLADAAMRQAIDKANNLQVPIIVAGDLHDTKANLRGECVNAMIETFKLCKTPVRILRGNHDALNEKSEQHSLNFLEPYALIVTNPIGIYSKIMIDLVPYHHDPINLKKFLKTELTGQGIVIMHQGVNSANAGEYIQDKSAITTSDVAGLRVISGHYHTRQTIDLPDGGKWDYIGNPFSLNFAEASDPEKGFQILMSDGSLEFVPTRLRRHVLLNVDHIPHSGIWQVTSKLPVEDIRTGDLILVKMRGPKEHLIKHDKKSVATLAGIPGNFRLDFIPTETEEFKALVKQLTNQELLDTIIEASQTSDEGKTRIKYLWRGML
jgi:DNA repair exonuclease SbcCD nuclease subunit